VSKNNVLRKIFGTKKGEINEPLRILHKEYLRDLCRSPSVVMIVKSGRLQWAGLVAMMGR